MADETQLVTRAELVLDLVDPLTAWRQDTDADADDTDQALDLLEDLPKDKRARALVMAGEMWPTDPDAWRRNGSAPILGPVEHLAIMAAGLKAQLVSGDPRDGRKLFDKISSGPYTSANRAAFVALDELGALDMLDDTLTRGDHARGTVPDAALDEAETVAVNTYPGRQWVEVADVGWLLFGLADN